MKDWTARKSSSRVRAFDVHCEVARFLNAITYLGESLPLWRGWCREKHKPDRTKPKRSVGVRVRMAKRHWLPTLIRRFGPSSLRGRTRLPVFLDSKSVIALTKCSTKA